MCITDSQCNRIADAKNELRAIAEGGELLCIFSGDPCNRDQYTSPVCHAFEGRAVAVVKTRTPGEVTLTVAGVGLASGTAKVTAK